MGVKSKTRDELWRVDVPITLIDPNDLNPNQMSEQEFDLLCDNMQAVGFTDPVLLRPKNLTALQSVLDTLKGSSDEELIAEVVKHDIRFETVGGHHRIEAGVFLGLTDVPSTIILSPEFDTEAADMQLIRHNVIKGHMDPAKFIKLYDKYSSIYSDEIMQHMMGFSDEAAFKDLIAQTAKSLPKEMQQKFKEAAEEVKTIDDLAKLLNKMFTEFGETLPYGYMIIDYGGQKSIWLRASKKTFQAAQVVGDMCQKHNRSMDAVFGKVMEALAKGEFEEQFAKIIKKTDPVEIPEGFTANPTEDNLSKVA